jgi:hypothetical protein
MGAGALERGFRAYRTRRRDPHAPVDRVADVAWRMLGIGAALVVASLLTMQLVHDSSGRTPAWLFTPFLVVISGAFATVFAGCLLIGWRSWP